ncbi:MAG: hypothetical protein K5842_07225, partial [Bacteroidales bacterium]|nr:hypothetical protein [Bacteroidales bacterium]
MLLIVFIINVGQADLLQAGSLRSRIFSLSRHDVTRWVVRDIDRGETVTTKTKKGNHISVIPFKKIGGDLLF